MRAHFAFPPLSVLSPCATRLDILFFMCFLIDVILFTFQRSVSIRFVTDDADDDDDDNNDGIVEHVLPPPICKLLLSLLMLLQCLPSHYL